jgi:hypothetical protein
MDIIYTSHIQRLALLLYLWGMPIFMKLIMTPWITHDSLSRLYNMDVEDIQLYIFEGLRDLAQDYISFMTFGGTHTAYAGYFVLVTAAFIYSYVSAENQIEALGVIISGLVWLIGVILIGICSFFLCWFCLFSWMSAGQRDWICKYL